MENFVITVNSWKPLNIITKSSILDVATVLDSTLENTTGFKPMEVNYWDLRDYSSNIKMPTVNHFRHCINMLSCSELFVKGTLMQI